MKRVAVILFALSMGGSAGAQDFSMMSNWAQGQMLNDNLQRNLQSAPRRTLPPRSSFAFPPRSSSYASPRSPGGRVRTTYRADPAVTRRVRAQFVDYVRSTDGPRGAEAIEQAFSREDPLRHWAAFVAEDGMRLGDVGDALTEYWVQNWKIANGVSDAPAPRVRAVRAQVEGVIGDNPSLGNLNEAQRQELAEIFIYNTMLQGEVYSGFLRSGDRAQMRRAGDAAVARFRREMHIDLRSLALTDQGFVRRG